MFAYLLKLISPQSDEQFQQYYHLRWRILRQPWNQPEGSERDKNDIYCYHIMAIKNDTIAGIARLEFTTKTRAQLRYMAVDFQYQKQGIGRLVIEHMEYYARQNKAHELFLNARENAVGFYKKLGYVITGKSYLLFDSIQHYKMMKKL